MRKGFTLVEVLITILLLTLLISTAMFSFKFFLKRLDRIDISLPIDAINYEYINRSINGIYFYPIQSIKNFKKVEKYFFQTTQNSFTYITTTPIYYDKISVAKIEYKDNKLYYYESKLFTKNQNYQNPKILENPYTKVIKKEIDSFKIDYVLYKDTKVPKSIKLKFNANDQWIFSIYSNNVSYKSDLKWRKN